MKDYIKDDMPEDDMFDDDMFDDDLFEEDMLENDMGLLGYAVDNDTAQVLEVLSLGADVNVRDFDGSTALHYAARFGNVKMAKALIKAGADVNATTAAGVTPLMDASEFGSAPFVKALLAAGAKVNVKSDAPGALSRAIYHKQKAVTDILRAAGAKLTLADAAFCSDMPHVQQLVAEGQTEDLDNALLHASFVGNIEMVRVLVQAGADVNAKNVEDYTPLHLAAFTGNEDIARYLLTECQPDLEMVNVDDETPLDTAVYSENVGVVREILQNAKVNVNRADAFGSTPLLHAVGECDIEMVKLLIGGGADVNATDNDGTTALELAISYDAREIEKILRKSGAKK